MNNDQTFFNTLADFRDVRPAIYNQNYGSQPRQSSVSSCTHAREFDIELNNNDKLLKNFKELREQLKEASKGNNIFRAKLAEKENQVDRLKVNEKDQIAANYQLKNQLKRLREENSEYKSKLVYLKEAAKGANKSNEEVQFLKVTAYELRQRVQTLQEENKKILEIGVIEKVELQEQIKMMEAKQKSEFGYMQDMEIQMSKMREKCIKLENELKKAEIKYDEELYNKKWMNGNFEKQHLEQQIRQLEKQNQELLSKHKKQKERRNGLEKRVLELEELSGLWTVKAETFQIENKALNKKFKKMEKKMGQFKDTSDKKMAESLAIEQKFMKAVNIGEQLISRVKRDLIGDAVALAKSCEFKLNKLKEEKDLNVVFNIKDTCPRKSPALARGRSRSKTRLSPTRKLFNGEQENRDQSERAKFGFPQSEIPSQRLRELGIRSDSNRPRKDSEETIESQNCPLKQIDNIELRIRRERQEMEKKIRQKMLYRQIEVANSPEKHRLRQDYFKLLDK